MIELYRLDKHDAARRVHMHPLTRRLPRNIPYLVDNLWEWARPERFPTRRHSVYASPSAEIAGRSGPTDGKAVFGVSIDDPQAQIVQLPIADAKEHDEVRTLPQSLIDILGLAWFTEAGFSARQTLAALWMPGLSRQETESILQQPELRAHRDTLFDKITFWREARLVDPDGVWPYPHGEVFFEASRWSLRPLT
jgi:hypothetical protein